MQDIKYSSIQKIKDIVDIGCLSVDGKIITLDALLLKIRRYQHLRFYYQYLKEGELDFLVRIQKKLDGDIVVCFILSMYGLEIERYNITDLVNSENFLVNLYNGICMQNDSCYGEAELNFCPKIKSLSLQFSGFVWLDFDRSFIENNKQYEKFFNDLYNSKFNEEFNAHYHLSCGHDSSVEKNKAIYKKIQ